MRELPPFARMKTRAQRYGGRMARSLPGSGLRHDCAFMHLPKCGGTSVSEALYATVPLHLKIGILDSPSIRTGQALFHTGRADDSYHDEGPNAETVAAFREQLLLMHMAHGCRLVHGHFLFSETAWREFGARYRYVTIMRDPVERTISNFRMDRRTGTFSGDLDSFLSSEEGRLKAQHALRFLSGRARIAPGAEADALAIALTNLERFSLVGFLDDLPGFAADFAAMFGPRPWIARHNEASDAGVTLSGAQRARLAELCAPDIALYDAARARFASKKGDAA
ncbi:MAG: hypothetical protein Q4F71_05375 [Paracoccus sp. (in: a-proteobacteria)]|nr:hypothetical protein [Paracoccus sp. (in: a-proteobacteria)]